LQKDFKHIIDTHYGILYKIGRAYTDNEADLDDLFQEMLIQLWKAFPSFKGQAKLSTWIYRVVLNTALTFKRNQKRQVRTTTVDQSLHAIAYETSNYEELEQERTDRANLLYSCINQLKKDDRAIILLHLEENTYEEIAEIIGIEANNVGVKIYRIKKRLFNLLKESGYGRV